MKNRGIFYALIIILGTSIGQGVAPLAYMGWEEIERAIWPPEPFNIDLEGIDWNGNATSFQDLWEENIADGDTTLGAVVWMPADTMSPIFMAPYSTSADYWIGPDSPTVASSRSNGFEYVILAVLFVLFVQSSRGKEEEEEEDEQGSTENR